MCVTFLQHMMVMEDMLKDFLLGEHLLLVGNQVSDSSWVLLSAQRGRGWTPAAACVRVLALIWLREHAREKPCMSEDPAACRS